MSNLKYSLQYTVLDMRNTATNKQLSEMRANEWLVFQNSTFLSVINNVIREINKIEKSATVGIV